MALSTLETSKIIARKVKVSLSGLTETDTRENSLTTISTATAHSPIVVEGYIEVIGKTAKDAAEENSSCLPRISTWVSLWTTI